MKYEGNTTAYPVESIEAQTQGPDVEEKTKEQTPGLDSEMKPAAIWTQLEFWDDQGKPYLQVCPLQGFQLMILTAI